MCHLQAMIAHVDGLVHSIPQYKKTWCMQGVRAAWHLGRWDLMDEYLTGADQGLVFSGSENNAFDMDLAKIFKAMMNKDQFLVAEQIFQSKQALLVPLAAAGMDSYMRAYPYVVKLHMLRELEDFNSLLGDKSFIDKSFSADDPKFLKLAKDWENRLRCTQPSLWTREPLLSEGWFLVRVICMLRLGTAGFIMLSSAVWLVIMKQLTLQYWKQMLQVPPMLTWRRRSISGIYGNLIAL